MIKKYKSIFIFFLFISMKSFSQSGSFCDSTGNVVIYSNYDGGILNINVDTNIANLQIGVVGYENDSIIISGTYLSNVTQVIFAGYYNSLNVHCNPWPSQKSIKGVPAAITQINFMPLATYNNPYGYMYIVCNYSCSDSTSQGGCNTPDQIADYFFNEFNSTKLLFHYTQYGCWNGTYNISDGGNCCSVPFPSGINEHMSTDEIIISPDQENGKFEVKSLKFKIEQLEIFDVTGKKAISLNPQSLNVDVNLSHYPGGIYLVKILSKEGKETSTRFVRN